MDSKSASTAPENLAPNTAPTPASPKAKVRLFAIFFFAMLFMVGFGISWYLHHSPTAAMPDVLSEEVDPPRPPVPESHEETAPPPPVRDKPSIFQGDEWLREGQYQSALAVYQGLVEEAKGPAPIPVHIRCALCQEMLGQWDQAMTHYQTVIRRGPELEVWLAHLGQARVHLARGNCDEARRLLVPLLLRHERLDPADPILAETYYLAGLALAGDLLSAHPASPLHDHVVGHSIQDWDLGRTLVWLTNLKQPKGQSDTEVDEIVLKPTQAQADQVIHKAVLATVEVTALVERLAQAGSMSTTWSKTAKEAAAHRSAALAVVQKPLLEVLGGLLEPLGLVCHLEGRNLAIETMAEKPSEWRLAYRQAEARRILNETANLYPEHALAAELFLALGNLEAEAGNSSAAVAWYARLLRDKPRSRLTLMANYNLGILLYQMGNHAEARKVFFRVVDQAPGHELTPQSYLRLGRMALEAGQAKPAAALCKRAAVAAADAKTRAVAALQQAGANLLADDSAAARAALTAHRDCLQHPPFRPAALFLTAYSNYRGGKGQKPSAREADELVTALLQLRQENTFGHVGNLLVGMAYRDLSMWDLAAQTYEHALKDLKGPLADEMAFHYAQALVKLEKSAEASGRLLQLVQSKSPWAYRAQFQLAQIDLENRRGKDCIQRCKQLLMEPTTIDQGDLLTLMGQAYERLGNFTQAARCYAGQLPDE